MRDRTPPPSFRLPLQSDPGREERKVTGAQAILLSVIAMALVCCAGGFAISLLTGDGTKKAAAVTQVTTAAPPVTETTTAPATTEAATEAGTEATTGTTGEATTGAAPRATTKVAAKPDPTTRKPKPAPTTRTTTTPAPTGGAVRPGAFCSPVGKFGHSSTGALMRCVRKPGEDRARWRKV